MSIKKIGFARSRHSGEPRIKSGAGTGVQVFFKSKKKLDSGFRRNDGKGAFGTSYKTIRFGSSNSAVSNSGSACPGPETLLYIRDSVLEVPVEVAVRREDQHGILIRPLSVDFQGALEGVELGIATKESP